MQGSIVPTGCRRAMDCGSPTLCPVMGTADAEIKVPFARNKASKGSLFNALSGSDRVLHASPSARNSNCLISMFAVYSTSFLLILFKHQITYVLFLQPVIVQWKWLFHGVGMHWLWFLLDVVVHVRGFSGLSYYNDCGSFMMSWCNGCGFSGLS